MRRPACYRERHQASPSLDPRQRRHTDAGSTLWPWCFDQAAVRGTSKSAVNDYLDRRFYHLRLERGGHRGTTRQYVARTDPSLRAVGCALDNRRDLQPQRASDWTWPRRKVLTPLHKRRQRPRGRTLPAKREQRPGRSAIPFGLAPQLSKSHRRTAPPRTAPGS